MKRRYCAPAVLSAAQTCRSLQANLILKCLLNLTNCHMLADIVAPTGLQLKISACLLVCCTHNCIIALKMQIALWNVHFITRILFVGNQDSERIVPSVLFRLLRWLGSVVTLFWVFSLHYIIRINRCISLVDIAMGYLSGQSPWLTRLRASIRHLILLHGMQRAFSIIHSPLCYPQYQQRILFSVCPCLGMSVRHLCFFFVHRTTARVFRPVSNIKTWRIAQIQKFYLCVLYMYTEFTSQPIVYKKSCVCTTVAFCIIFHFAAFGQYFCRNDV